MVNNVFAFLWQSSVCFSILYVVYLLFFSRLTYHKINRVILLAIPVMSLLLPFSDIYFEFKSPVIIELTNAQFTLDNFEEYAGQISGTAVSKDISFSFQTALFILYLVVMLIFLFRILFSVVKIIRISKSSISLNTNIIVADVETVFSFHKHIFIPEKEINNIHPKIIEHEMVHIKHRHTYDRILTELYIAFFWLNPLVYLFRKSVKSIHEFTADQEVVRGDISPSEYLTLLSQTFYCKHSSFIHSYFNHSLIKKRIDMISKTKSSRFNYLKYVVILPVIALLLLAFSSKTNTGLSTLSLTETSANVFKNSTPPNLFPVANGTIEDITHTYGKKFTFPGEKNSKMHGGIDIRGKIGTNIIATGDGIITKASAEKDWGNLIIVSHPGGYSTWYAHLQNFNIKEGQQVSKGDVIGFLGNTGKSTGPHLHYEIRQNDKRLDPIDIINK